MTVLMLSVFFLMNKNVPVCIIGWGESGEAISHNTLYYNVKFRLVDSRLFGQVRLSDFFGGCRNIFRAKLKYYLSAPLEKNGPYAYALKAAQYTQG